MGRALLVLWNDAKRNEAIEWIRKAPKETRVTFQGPVRSLDQNSRQWAILTEISTQLLWHGHHYPPETWKEYFMHDYQGAVWMPHEDGGMVPIGRSTSKLSKEEHSEFTALLEAFAARHNVALHEPDAERAA